MAHVEEQDPLVRTLYAIGAGQRVVRFPEPQPAIVAQFTVDVTEEVSATGRTYFVAVMKDSGLEREVAWSAGVTVLDAVQNVARLAHERSGR